MEPPKTLGITSPWHFPSNCIPEQRCIASVYSRGTGLSAEGPTAATPGQGSPTQHRSNQDSGTELVNSLFAKHCPSRPTTDCSPYQVLSSREPRIFPRFPVPLEGECYFQLIRDPPTNPLNPAEEDRVTLALGSSHARRTAPLRIALRRSFEPRLCTVNHLRLLPLALCCAEAGREVKHDSSPAPRKRWEAARLCWPIDRLPCQLTVFVCQLGWHCPFNLVCLGWGT